jgi:hypothetical protein
MDMGIKSSNNEPGAKIRWHEKSVRMGVVQHDKDDGDINGTFEAIATFVYVRSPRSGSLSTTQSITVQSRRKVTPPDIAGPWLRAVFGAL